MPPLRRLSKAAAELIRSQILRARQDVWLVLKSDAMWSQVTVRGELHVAVYLRELQKHLMTLHDAGATVDIVQISERSAVVTYTRCAPDPMGFDPEPPGESADVTKECPKCGTKIVCSSFVPTWPVYDLERGPGQRFLTGQLNDVEYELHVATCTEKAP